MSPLLANIYLHYVLDLWFLWWRVRCACGEMIVVRYADDFIIGLQSRRDATRIQAELEQRLRRFGLELHPGKTRLIEFGRYAVARRREHGAGKPETFDFLGFTHVCGRTRSGRFTVLRRTMATRLRRKLGDLKAELRRRRHHRVRDVGNWLAQVVRGHNAYYGVPLNSAALSRFRWELVKLWYRVLRRRSQRTRITWARMARIARRYLPTPRIVHPFPREALRVTTQGRSPVR